MHNKISFFRGLPTMLVPALSGCSGVSLFAQTITAGGDSGSAPFLTMSSQPPTNMSVIDFNDSGITLTPYGSPQFASLLAATVSPAVSTAIQALLPYCVFVRNGSSKTVIAYTVSWASIDKMGEPFIGYQTAWDVILLSPQAAGLATIVGPLNAGSLIDSEEVAEQAQSLRGQSSVTIALDAVLFADGTSIGKDSSQAIPQVRARLRSERDLFMAVLAKANNGDTSGSIMSWLQTISDQVKPGTALKFDKDTFQEWYRFYQSRSAGILLRFAIAKSVPEMIASVRSTLETKPYPPCRRQINQRH